MQTVEILDELVEKGSENMDVRNKDEVITRMKAAVASKQFGQEDFLSSLVADVILSLQPMFTIAGFITFLFNEYFLLCATGMYSSMPQESSKL